jgi:hypothetical protein
LDDVSGVFSSLGDNGGLGKGKALLENGLVLKVYSVFLTALMLAAADSSCNKAKEQAVSKSLGL